MTQNTLSEEIEGEINKFADSMPGRICFMLVTEKDFGNILTQFRIHMRSIAEKTVEAVRVEKKEELDVFIEDGDLEGIEIDGFNQAVTEQSKLASRWLGKDTNLA